MARRAAARHGGRAADTQTAETEARHVSTRAVETHTGRSERLVGAPYRSGLAKATFDRLRSQYQSSLVCDKDMLLAYYNECGTPRLSF
jgi:hypothetical protein